VGAAALPATPATFAAYLAALADLRLKVSTISRRAAAIAYAHKLGDFEPPINESVKAVKRGAPVYLPVIYEVHPPVMMRAASRRPSLGDR
jgi:hypothetical protein